MYPGVSLRSFIKIYGPPVLDAIRVLEGIAIDMPDVCIMNSVIIHEIPRFLTRDIGGRSAPYSRSPTQDPFLSDWSKNYFGSKGMAIPVERRSYIISRSGASLGDYDFYFEWEADPEMDRLFELIDLIDMNLAPLGCRYTITTKT